MTPGPRDATTRHGARLLRQLLEREDSHDVREVIATVRAYCGSSSNTGVHTFST